MARDLITLTDHGLHCAAGDFHIDPWRPVPRAVVTHAHADHARWGCDRYLVAAAGERVFRRRLGRDAALETVGWGERRTIGGVAISLHPAGHILGSAQIRVEYRGEVWVVSGDYKTDPDPTCVPWEPVRCHTFVTECTFGLPVYRWPTQAEVFGEIDDWWRANAAEGRASLLYGYALGKAQRLLAGVDPSIGPIFLHGAVDKLTDDYRESGITLPPTRYATVDAAPEGGWGGALVIAPPSAHGTPWMRRFGAASTAFASGWMRVRGMRRRRSVDRGFVLSDHVDWPQLMDAIEATGAERVWATHGSAGAVVRWLEERGLEARAIPTRWEGETDAEGEEEAGEET